ncbi:MAG: alpha/beta hydrolase [Dehalococcoidia bacterium]
MPDSTSGRTLRLADGRSLGYAVGGDPNGRPLFFFHGFPGSRLQAHVLYEAASRSRASVISLDRPGFGLSDYKRGRRINDWPSDVAEAADALEIDRFAVAGFSGGGPYALACAQSIPQRLTGVAAISSIAPLDGPGVAASLTRRARTFLRIARYTPLTSALSLYWLERQARRNPERLIARLAARSPPADGALLRRPEVMTALADDLREAFRTGTRGPNWDLGMLSRPWGFRVEEIPVRVHLWHGDADTLVPSAAAHYLAGAIPDCDARFYADEGHFLILDRERAKQIMAALSSG